MTIKEKVFCEIFTALALKNQAYSKEGAFEQAYKAACYAEEEYYKAHEQE